MAKLEKQYKGTRGSSVNLPNLSVSTARPLGAATASQVYDAMTENISKMQVFLEDRAKSAAVEAGFKYSLSNTPTTEEIEAMVSDPSQPTVKEKLPFKNDSVNVAEQTARTYISEKIRFKAELQAEEKLQKLFTMDAFNEDLSVSEVDARALDIVNQYGQMFTGNRTAKDAFDTNMSVYLKGQRKSNLSVRNQVFLQEESADIDKRLIQLEESNMEVYNSNEVVNRMSAVMNRYDILENHIKTTVSYNRVEQLNKVDAARDKAVQNLTSTAFLEYSKEPQGELNKLKLQTLINDVSGYYKGRPQAALKSIVGGVVLAAGNDDDLSAWNEFKQLDFEGKNIQLHPSWKLIEGNARDAIVKKQDENIKIDQAEEANTVFVVTDLLVKNFGTTKVNSRSQQETFVKTNYPTLSDQIVKEILDKAEKRIQTDVLPEMSDVAMSNVIESIQKEIDLKDSSAAYVTKEYLKENFHNSNDEKLIEQWSVNYDTDVTKLPTYNDFQAPLKFRQKDIASNILDVGTEDYRERENRLQNLFKAQVLNKNIGDVMIFLTTKHDTSDDVYNNLFEKATFALLDDLEKTAADRGVTLSDLNFDNLSNTTKQKVLQLFSYHSSYLHISGANDKEKFARKMKKVFEIFGVNVADDYEVEYIFNFVDDVATGTGST
tara:strand:- start:8244 stop:10223 length:1980 start_codon:yes stop_codon:yes gene_type:complete